MIFNLKTRKMDWGKIITFLITIILLTTFSTGVVRAQNNVGYVSLTKITASHPNTEKMNQLYKELRTELQTSQE
jgi:Skp family chaperone for outer membrane proteins